MYAKKSCGHCFSVDSEWDKTKHSASFTYKNKMAKTEYDTAPDEGIKVYVKMTEFSAHPVYRHKKSTFDAKLHKEMQENSCQAMIRPLDLISKKKRGTAVRDVINRPMTTLFSSGEKTKQPKSTTTVYCPSDIFAPDLDNTYLNCGSYMPLFFAS